MRFITLALAAAVTFNVSVSSAAEGHTKDKVVDIKKRLKDKKAVLIDVREKREWDAGHLKDAKLVPLSELRKSTISKDVLKGLPKNKIIYCHCKSGGRVLMATSILKKKGYDIRPLKLGYSDLLKQGFEKAKPKKKKSSGK